MPTVTMLDTQQVDLAIVIKNAQGAVVSPPPVLATPTANVPAAVDLSVSADNSTVTVKGKTVTAQQTVVVTCAAAGNPNCKATQVVVLNPDPTFPATMTIAPGTPVAQ